MEQALETARSIYEGEIVREFLINPYVHGVTYVRLTVGITQDFEGQRLAEYITYGLLTVVGVIAFFVGFATQDIYQTLYIGLGGTALAFVVVVPPWPYFNRKPQPWLPARTGRGAWQGINIEVDGKKIR